MTGTMAAPHDDAEQRIARALDRIERAASDLGTHQGLLRQAACEALADIDRLIAKASPHG